MDPFSLFVFALLGATVSDQIGLNPHVGPRPKVEPGQVDRAAEWIEWAQFQARRILDEGLNEEDEPQLFELLGLDQDEIEAWITFLDDERPAFDLDGEVARLDDVVNTDHSEDARISIETEDEYLELRVFEDNDAAEEAAFDHFDSMGDDELLELIGAENILQALRWGTSWEDFRRTHAIGDGIEYELSTDHTERTLKPLEWDAWGGLIRRLDQADVRRVLSPMELSIAAQRFADAGDLRGELLTLELLYRAVSHIPWVQSEDRRHEPPNAEEIAKAKARMTDAELVLLDHMLENQTVDGTPFDAAKIARRIDRLREELEDQHQTDWARIREDLGFSPTVGYRVD